MNPWLFLPIGYVLTVLIETPVLVFGLSPVHPLRRRLFAGAWLTACTYPIVILVLPVLFSSDRILYLAVAETFAPLAECVIFGLAFHRNTGLTASARVRDFVAITLANVASFLIGACLLA